MNWVVYLASITAVLGGATLAQYDEPIWGGVLVGLGIAFARLSGEMEERNSKQ